MNAEPEPSGAPLARWLKWLPTLMLLIAAGYLGRHYPDLPERVPTHFGLRGEPDGWGPKYVLVFLPGLGLLLDLLVAFFSNKPQYANFPVAVTDENRERLYALYRRMMLRVRLLTAALMAVLTVYSVDVARELRSGLDPRVMGVLVGALLVDTFFWIVRMRAAGRPQ